MFFIKFNNYFVYVINLLLLIITIIDANKCIRRHFQASSFVCVCNETYCDSIKPLPNEIKSGQYVLYSSSRRMHRMEQEIKTFTDNPGGSVDIKINRGKKYQNIMGFGGAMTDAAGINIASLPKSAQDLLMKQYFGENSIQYNILRVPVGGTDFSTHPYSLDDTPNDTNFTDFKLAFEDIQYKIPYLRQAKNLSTQPIKLMGCSWTAPAYMKDNNDLIGGSRLLDQYFQLYADYITKFLQTYKNEGFTFDIMSAENEPAVSVFPEYIFNGMGFDPNSQAKFVALLGPTLGRNGFGDVKIMIGDDQRPFMYDWVKDCMKNPDAAKYIAGVGIHWYFDNDAPPEILTDIHKLPGFENKFILYTEACAGSLGKIRGVRLGSWYFGETYLDSIIDDLNHWGQGWMDWNLALDLQGGPNWVKNFVDAPIIVNKTSQEFFKNPMYYALGHATTFLPPGSIRIDMVNNHGIVKATAFETPNNQTVIILMNKQNRRMRAPIQDTDRNMFINIDFEPNSMYTVIY